MANTPAPGAPEDGTPTPAEAEAITNVLEDDESANESTPDGGEPSQGAEAEPKGEDESADDGDDSGENQDDDQKDDQEADETDDQEDQDQDEKPVDPKEEARRRYADRQRQIQERRSRIESTGQEYIQAGEDEYDQRIRAMEVEAYSNKVEANENSLITEFERVKANPELEIFNPESPNFNQKVYEKTLRDYNAGYVQYDSQGNIVEVKGSLFEHFKETAELLSGATNAGKIQQVRSSRQMRANADPAPAAPPKGEKADPIMDVLTDDE